MARQKRGEGADQAMVDRMEELDPTVLQARWVDGELVLVEVPRDVPVPPKPKRVRRRK